VLVQLEFFDVPSPCVGICQSNAKGYCLGCMRTRDERQNWINLDNDNKQKVIKRCIQRKKRQATTLDKQKDTQEVNLLEPAYEAEQPSLLDPASKTAVTRESDLDFGDFEL
jgi:predicted Fe-S protein YdhL (DUF1289 family)